MEGKKRRCEAARDNIARLLSQLAAGFTLKDMSVKDLMLLNLALTESSGTVCNPVKTHQLLHANRCFFNQTEADAMIGMSQTEHPQSQLLYSNLGFCVANMSIYSKGFTW